MLKEVHQVDSYLKLISSYSIPDIYMFTMMDKTIYIFIILYIRSYSQVLLSYTIVKPARHCAYISPLMLPQYD